jgi:hypothetical protein
MELCREARSTFRTKNWSGIVVVKLPLDDFFLTAEAGDGCNDPNTGEIGIRISLPELSG